MQFPCKSCGECCKHVGGFPSLDRGDGICRHFDEASAGCTVYDSRPTACSVDRAYETLFKGRIAPTVYYMAQAVACAGLQADNADMPARMEQSLRDAGMFDDGAQIDLNAVQQTIVSALTADPDRHFSLRMPDPQ